MKIGADRRICVKCKVEQSIFDYDIQWVDKCWESSYVKRVCQTCEGEGGPDPKLEKAHLRALLRKLSAKRLQMQIDIDNCNVSITEVLEQLETWK